jgi:hypothetical protein
MNTAEGVRRLAQVIRGGSTVLAGICFLSGVVLGITGSDFVNALANGVFIGVVLMAIGHSVAWVLLGFAGDRSPPKGPSDC